MVALLGSMCDQVFMKSGAATLARSREHGTGSFTNYLVNRATQRVTRQSAGRVHSKNNHASRNLLRSLQDHLSCVANFDQTCGLLPVADIFWNQRLQLLPQIVDDPIL